MRLLKGGMLAAMLILIMAGCTGTTAQRGGNGQDTQRQTGTFDDWFHAVCMPGTFDASMRDPIMCSTVRGERGGFRGQVSAYEYESEAEMQSERKTWAVGFGYAICKGADGSVAVFSADVSGIGSSADANYVAAQAIEPLAKFGCVITMATASSPAQSPPASSTRPSSTIAAPTPHQTATDASPVPAATTQICRGTTEAICPAEQRYAEDLRGYGLWPPTRTLREFVNVGWGICGKLTTKSAGAVLEELFAQGHLTRTQIQILINIAQNRLCPP